MMRIALVIMLALFMLLGTGCNHEGSHVIVSGSTSVQPYVEILAEEYSILYPEKVIDVQGGGSSAGIMAVESEIADIGMSSRLLKASEEHLWVVEIARDGLAMILHPANPLSDLSRQQIRSIYAGEITNWSELGGADAKIHVIAREESSGTRSAFEELVMHEHRITPRAIVQSSNGAVRQVVSGDPNSIGFISLGLVDETVKAVKLNGVAATMDNVLTGDYALYRPFLFISIEEPTGYAAQFLEFVLSPEGQQHMINEGLVPFKESDIDEEI